MKIYQNGDRCPCCGKEIEGKTDDWLEVFSQLCHVAGLADYSEEELALETPVLLPPDAGINPPAKPKL